MTVPIIAITGKKFATNAEKKYVKDAAKQSVKKIRPERKTCDSCFREDEKRCCNNITVTIN
jgi:hypothetical protein